MITVYGADWCGDTRRARRHLRRLGVAHQYLNVDEDLDALDRAKAINGGQRRTPTIDLGMGGTVLVEPDNDTLTAAIVEVEMLTRETADERLEVQNVGDMERAARAVAGVALMALSPAAPPALRRPMALLGAAVSLTGLSGWCPVYYAAGVNSLGGPGDRPDEATRGSWLAPRKSSAPQPHHLEETA
jgi:mycoredoxin